MVTTSPRCMATLIGSLPLTDPDAAVRLVMRHLDEAPIWPELPRRTLMEGMVESHSGGLPCLRVDEEAGKVRIDTAGDCAAELTAFYERAMAAEESRDFSAFAVSAAHASALEPAARAMEASGRTYPFIKVQCVGPVSFGLQLTDMDDKPLYYDETYQDVLTRQVALQSCWMVHRFRSYGRHVIAFLDEPSLAAFGSSGYLGVLREDVVRRLGAAAAALKAEGAVVGVHVCGNTEWPMIIEAGADLLNYDAYAYGPSMLIYAAEVERFLRTGGILAWGIVPTSEAIRAETAGALEKRFFDLVDGLAGRGVDRELILSRSMLTPSCGMGSMAEPDAIRVVETLAELAGSVQSRVRS